MHSTTGSTGSTHSHARKGLEHFSVFFEEHPSLEITCFHGPKLPEAPILALPLMFGGETFIYSLAPDLDRMVGKAPFRFWLDGSLNGSMSNTIPLQARVQEDKPTKPIEFGYYMPQLLAGVSGALGRSIGHPQVAAAVPVVIEQLWQARKEVESHCHVCANWLKEVLA